MRRGRLAPGFPSGRPPDPETVRPEGETDQIEAGAVAPAGLSARMVLVTVSPGVPWGGMSGRSSIPAAR